LAKKDRPPRQKMPEQPAEERRHNFDEVPYGYTEELARAEASRCLKCKKPQCVQGCPVAVDIPGFIELIVEGKHADAARAIKRTNSLPAICGRVCPQEEQCEALCVLGKKGEPVAVGRLERFAADWEREHDAVEIPELAPSTGKKVAVVGAGPAGLTVAGDLIKLGHAVTIFEALHKPGGVLAYGIPEFRLPKAIVGAEVDYLKSLGVELEFDTVIGKTISMDELLEEHDSVFIGSGAGLPWFLGIPGENLSGVYSANEYLTRSNLMKAYRDDYDTPIHRGKRVGVVGGGNVAMDSARTALRLGADEVMIVYRRGRVEMPARNEEIHHAEEEGVQFNLLTNPVEVLGDEDGWVRGMKCIRMELGEPDDSGRRRPVPIEGSEFELPLDTAIIAIGNSPNPLIPSSAPGLATGRRGNIVAEEATGATSLKGVFAGGDIVTGAATVIAAMGAGRVAAKHMDRYLADGVWPPEPDPAAPAEGDGTDGA